MRENIWRVKRFRCVEQYALDVFDLSVFDAEAEEKADASKFKKSSKTCSS